METFTSNAWTWDGDDNAAESSIEPPTPEGSPFFSACGAESTIQTRLSSLSDVYTSDESSRGQARPSHLPDIVNPATAAGVSVRNLCFIGAGYVGAPTAAVIALKNPSLRVTVVDRDESRIRKWNSAHLPIHEPGLRDVVRIARDGSKVCTVPSHGTDSPSNKQTTLRARQPNLVFTTDCTTSIANADLIFIAVNTPTKTTGLGAGYATDMTALESAVREIAQNAKNGAILVEKSTVPCRTARLIQNILDASNPGARFQVLSNPEFLSEGTAIENLMHPDRVLIGSPNTIQGRRAAAALAKVYASWVEPSKILGTRVWSSELSKLVANAMLAQRISSINSISAICERTGADVHEISQAVGMDPRIGSQFLKSGLGFGGSCFRKDIGSLVYLARSLGLDEVGDYWNQVLVINELQRGRFARKVISRLNGTLIGKKITLLGFAFKKNTGDTRESLAIEIIRILLEERPAEIAIFDPHCSQANIQRELDHLDLSPEAESARHKDTVKIYADPYQACFDTNAILIVTDWDMFRMRPSKPDPPHPEHRAAEFAKRSVPGRDEDVFPSLSPSQPVAVTSPVSDQYLPEPPCPADCPDCGQSNRSFAPDEENLEWARVAYHMRDPKWVFDGRAVLDIAEMEQLGVRVDALGRAESGVSLF